MGLLKIVNTPLATVEPGTTVMEAVEVMAETGVGAVAVLDQGKLAGIFTERDVMLRVVLRNKSPQQTEVGEVMTTPVETVTDDTSEEDALVHMVERHIRHLVIVDKNGEVKAVLSIRHLLEHRIDELARELHSLDQYLSNDGPGG
ncbi:MAG TPA: CBS domain-containing protein [Terriglobia bacterium]|jgi:CBS domain-containing protein|nr:CBS domain-containing protein [Terriglobia bacterium]